MELITDRTIADVNRAKELNRKLSSFTPLTAQERTEWMAGMKGSYNYTDLNRVGRAAQEIASMLNALPGEIEAYRKAKEAYANDEYAVKEFDVVVTPKLDWTMTDQITPAAMTAYLNNIIAIRAALPDGCPAVPGSMRMLTYEGANDIERILQTVHNSAMTIKNRIIAAIDKAALLGTDWDKYTYTEKEVYRPYATLSNFETIFDGPTDETSITGWSGYTTEWVDLPDGRRECHYVPRGAQRTIYATGQSSTTVYTFPDDYTVESHTLFLLSDGPKRHTMSSTVTTHHSTKTIYDTKDLIGTVHTDGFAYPDGIEYPIITATYKGEPSEMVGGRYYYIRIR